MDVKLENNNKILIDLETRNPELHSRLLNFKFSRATNHLENEPEEIKNLVNALASTFSNMGWTDGNIGLIINHALHDIGVNMFE